MYRHAYTHSYILSTSDKNSQILSGETKMHTRFCQATQLVNPTLYDATFQRPWTMATELLIMSLAHLIFSSLFCHNSDRFPWLSFPSSSTTVGRVRRVGTDKRPVLCELSWIVSELHETCLVIAVQLSSTSKRTTTTPQILTLPVRKKNKSHVSYKSCLSQISIVDVTENVCNVKRKIGLVPDLTSKTTNAV